MSENKKEKRLYVIYMAGGRMQRFHMTQTICFPVILPSWENVDLF